MFQTYKTADLNFSTKLPGKDQSNTNTLQFHPQNQVIGLVKNIREYSENLEIFSVFIENLTKLRTCENGSI